MELELDVSLDMVTAHNCIWNCNDHCGVFVSWDSTLTLDCGVG